MQRFTVSVGRSREARRVKRLDLTWDQFCERFSKPVKTNETYAQYEALGKDEQLAVKDVGYFVAGAFTDDVRGRRNLEYRSMLTLDLDHCAPKTAAYICGVLGGFELAIASTHKSTRAKPRLRLVIPLLRNVSDEEYEPLSRLLAETIGIDLFDDTTFQSSRIMFWGSHSSDIEPFYHQQPGALLDPDRWLTEGYDDWKDPREWATSSRVDAIEHKPAGAVEDPRDKSGPIGTLCRAYTISEAMDELLPGVYKQGTIEGRYTYTQGTSANGAVVYDDLWLYSHHESDPTFGQLCNVYDMVRIHKFGSLPEDEQTAELMALIRQDPRCQDETRAATLAAFGATPATAEEREEESAKEEKKKKVPLIDQFLQRFIFVTQGSLVCDLQLPPSTCLIELNDFHNTYASLSHKYTVKTAAAKDDEDEKEKEKSIPVSKLWLLSKKRITAHDLVFDPATTERVILGDDRVRRINTFHMPVWEPTDDVDKLDTFKEHMLYLIPDKRELKWFLDWLAFNLQYPERRSKITPLHVSREQGTGRGWVVQVIWRLLGNWNCRKTKIENLMAGPNKTVYHDCFQDSLFCAIDEVKQGANRFEINDHIKDLLEADELELNIKYGRQGTRRIYTNFLMQSNHTDALILEERDRRINVLSGPLKPKDDSYYVHLYKWLDDDAGIRQLANLLLRRDLSAFLNETRSMNTPGRQEMIRNSRSETEELYYEWFNGKTPKYATINQIFAMIRQLEDPMRGFEENQVRKLVQKTCRRANGGVQIRVGEDNRKERVWQIRQGPEDDLRTIAACVERLRVDVGA